MSAPAKLCRRLLLALMLPLLLAAGRAGAQQPSPTDLTDISLEDLSRVKVYSASKHLEDVDGAPSAVTVLTAEDIRRFGWRTLAEALNSVRGFYFSYDRDYVYLGVLGVLRPTDYNSRILLMINGHRLNDNVYDSAQVGSEFPLDMDLVERIEVVRGPASSLFGSNALFGVINVITRQPDKQSAIEVNADARSRMGRFGSVTATFTSGALSGLLSGSLLRSNGNARLYFPEFDFPDSNYGYAIDLDGERADHAFGDFQYGRFRLQALYSNRTKDLPTAPFGSMFNSPPTYSVDRRSYLDLSYHRPLSSTTDLDVRAYYNYVYSQGSGMVVLRPDTPVVRAFATGSGQWVGTEATVGRQFGKNRITVGGQYEYTFDINQKNDAPALPPPIFDQSNTMWLAAAYGQAELNLTSKLKANAGLRLDWFHPYGAAVSPRLALVYEFTNKTSLKYIFGRAFRAPNAYENWYQDLVVIGPHPDTLKPEHIQSQNVMLEHKLGYWGELLGEFFYNHLTQLIDLQPDLQTGLMEFANSGEYHSTGVGFELNVHTKRGLKARASYMLADADAGRQQMANDPVHTVKVNASAPFSRWTVAGVELQYQSSQLNYLGSTVPGSLLTNVTVSTKPLWNDWQFSASCYNLFNRTWYLPAGRELSLGSIQQDGRTLRVTLTYRLPLGKGEKGHD